MTGTLHADAPLEVPQNAISRTVSLLVDTERDDRAIGIDCWYPAAAGDFEKSFYEILPGVGFTTAAFAAAPSCPLKREVTIRLLPLTSVPGQNMPNWVAPLATGVAKL